MTLVSVSHSTGKVSASGSVDQCVIRWDLLSAGGLVFGVGVEVIDMGSFGTYNSSRRIHTNHAEGGV